MANGTESEEIIDMLGDTNQEQETSIEREILNLKDTAKFIESKVKLMQIEACAEPKNYNDADLEKKKSDLINTAIDKQDSASALHNIFIAGYAKFTAQNTSDDAKIVNYKEKILELLELIKSNSKLINETDRSENAVGELSQVHNFINESNSFFELCQEKKIQYQKDCATNYTDDYKKHMDKVNDRIRKINFMRIFMRRLVIYSLKNSKAKNNFIEVLKYNHSHISIDSLSKD